MHRLKQEEANKSNRQGKEPKYSYSKALGIGCSFCHASHASIADSLDYASDKNEMKLNARNMMKLTIDINQKYFYYDSSIAPIYLNTVHCKTCHRGEPYPVE